MTLGFLYNTSCRLMLLKDVSHRESETKPHAKQKTILEITRSLTKRFRVASCGFVDRSGSRNVARKTKRICLLKRGTLHATWNDWSGPDGREYGPPSDARRP